MKIAFGNDHAGLSLRPVLLDELKRRGDEVVDFGTATEDSVDYPDYAKKVGELVASGQADRGVLVCGTGIGISIAANKIHGIRAAVVTDEYGARMTREHNDSNVIAMRAREFDPEEGRRLLGIWLDTPFSAGPRHMRRIAEIKAMES